MLKHGVFAALLLASLGLASAAGTDDGAPGPLGLPSVDSLKLRLSMTDEQARKCGGVYDEYKEKAREIDKKSSDEKRGMRNEIVSKLKEFLSADQQKKLDQIVNEPQK